MDWGYTRIKYGIMQWMPYSTRVPAPEFYGPAASHWTSKHCFFDQQLFYKNY